MDLVQKFVDGDNEAIDKILVGGLWPIHKKKIEELMKTKYRPKKFYYYLITFTVKPECKNYDEIEKFIESQFSRPALKIVESHIVKEYTKKNIPHWHVSVKSERFIAKNRFNYYAKKFGYVDISKTMTNDLSESLNYINKEHESKKL